MLIVHVLDVLLGNRFLLNAYYLILLGMNFTIYTSLLLYRSLRDSKLKPAKIKQILSDNDIIVLVFGLNR